MIIISVYGSGYDYIKENADQSRHKFVDCSRNFLVDASLAKPGDISFLFVTDAQVSLAGKEDFLVEVKGLEAEGDLPIQIAAKIAQFATDNFSYYDCGGHDMWDIPRTTLCIVERPNQKSISFSTPKKVKAHVAA
jgi:hypothetical protein